MRLHFLKALLLLLLASFTVQAQELYMPRNIKNAYVNGTRSYDGKPGKNYWINHGKYDISVSVDPATRLVTGKESISYTNNSPDTLKSVAIRFVNNLHKPEAPRSGYVSPDFLTTGLNIISFSVNGEVYQINSAEWGTVADVKLKSPLLSGKSATFKIAWSYPLSKQSGREGQIDSTTFFVAYSYPRISVYDDYNGWDIVPHTDRNEFYNDFNDYKLSIRAPKNYVVWATGDLQNPDEVLQPEYASRLKKSYTTNEIIHVASAQEMKDGKVTAQKDWNTWKFTADHITDVCFAMSSHYLWDASSVVVDRKTNRRASTQAAYDAKGTDFVHSVKYSSYALDWFSNNWPGIPYPFSKMTAVQGFADMEYPMMVNDSNWDMDAMGRFVQDHEIAHTYFPFYMGINETRYAYMDEGWATTLEYLIALSYNDKASADLNYKNFRVKRWINDPSTEEDQPIISMSTQVSGAGYGNNSYVKASLSYLALKDMLGDEGFKKALHTYTDRWNGKHPLPWDFFYSVNDAAKQDLNWFWNNWFFSNNYIDLAIDRVTVKGTGYGVSVKNTGGFAVPFDVIATYADGKEQTFHKTPSIWKNNQKQALVQIEATQPVKSIRLDGGIFMDAKPADNNWNK